MNPLPAPRLTRAEADALLQETPNRLSKRILLTGDPGIGKSSVLKAAAVRFSEAGHLVLQANPSFTERNTPYSMLWDLLSDVDLEPATMAAENFRSIMDTALGARSPSSETPSLATAVALEGILAELTVSAQVILLIDDLHHSDVQSQATVERAFRRMVPSGVSLVATTRDHGTWGSGRLGFTFPPADVYALDGLSIDELEALVRPAWPSTLTRAQIFALREHTGGNPMWALDLIRRGATGDIGALSVGSIEAPAPLDVAVADRLAALSPAAADAVAIVALLGRPDIDLLVKVLLFAGSSAGAINEAEAAGFIDVTTRTASVRHPVHASAAVGRLDRARLRELHAFVADAVDDPVLQAQHLEQSRPPGPDEDVASALARAAVVMRRQGARLRSAHFDTQAVERTDALAPLYQDRLLTKAQQFFSAGDHAACLRALRHLSVDRLDLHQYDAYLALSVSSLTFSSDRDAARSFLNSAAGAIREDTARAAIVSANIVASTRMTVSHRAAMSTSVLRTLDGRGAPNAVHRALRGSVRSRLDAGRGLDVAAVAEMDRRQGIEIVAGLDDTGLATTAFFAHLVDDVVTSRRAVAALVEWAKREGKEGVERIFIAHAAAVELAGGDAVTARELFERSGYATASATLPSELQHTAGLLLISAGRHDDLAQMVDLWKGSTAPESGVTVGYPALLGISAFAQRNWVVAAEHLRIAASAADSLELVELGSRLRVDFPLIEASLRSGEVAEATRRLDNVRSFLAERDRPISQIALHRMTSLHHASQGDLRGALTEATIAIDLSARLGRPADEARALLQRARVLRRLRRVTLARTDLHAARSRALDTGVDDLQVEIELASSTARTTHSGSELTQTESRVLSALKRGDSNKEIAAHLFVSVRTVESHVSAILRKTGMSSRSRLISHR